MGKISKLHKYTYEKIRQFFPYVEIKENYYPEWLLSSNTTRLELDIYIEEFSLAVEIQGEQHYRFVKHFHGDYKNFKKQIMYDREKRDMCYGKGIELLEVSCSSDVDNAIKHIAKSKNAITGKEYFELEKKYIEKMAASYYGEKFQGKIKRILEIKFKEDFRRIVSDNF